MSTLRRAALCALLSSALPALALAQSGRVLHEYFEIPAGANASPLEPGAKDDESAALSASRRPSASPPLTLGRLDGEAIFGTEGAKRERALGANPQGALNPLAGANRLDRDTTKVDPLGYAANFDPSVLPYKRVVARDRIETKGGEYAAVGGGGPLSAVPIEGGAARADEDEFWGSFLVSAEPGALIPLPSVAPNQRALQIESEPRAAITLWRDGADNFFMRADRRGVLRLNLRLAAPRTYFGGELGETDWASIGRLGAPALNAQARGAAERVLGALGIGRTDPPRAALFALIEHFRGFEERALGDGGGEQDTYAAIALGGVGVCRHRSLAFMVSALALGIPARYVYNEAHAFVEVRWPRTGWRRIDLGGAAQQIETQATRPDQSVHQTVPDDDLPRPESFERALAAAPAARDLIEGASASGGARSDEPGPASFDPSAEGTSAASSPEPGAAPASDRDPAAPASYSDPSPRVPTRLIGSWGPEVRAKRGSTIELGGRIEPGRAGLVVRAILRDAGGSGARTIGRARTGPEGAFMIEAEVPPDLEVGRWRIEVIFDGDAELAPASAE